MKFKDAFLPGQVFTVSNLLSVLRVLILPFFVCLAIDYSERPDGEGLAWLLLFTAVAVVADFLDGFLARRWGQITRLGQYLDPVCDKIVSTVTLGLLAWKFHFPVWVFIVYLAREVVGVWGGTYLYFKRDIQGSPNWFGKIGVGVIAITVVWYLCVPYLGTTLPGDSLFLRPEFAAYALVVVLLLGVAQYVLTYYKVVFFPDRAR